MLRTTVSHYFRTMQRQLFPGFAEELGQKTDKHLQVIVALDVLEVEKFIPYRVSSFGGRPPIDRSVMARSFVAKAVLNMPTTLALIDRLKVDAVLRRICGFETKLPSEGTFSNAFAEFAESGMLQKIHETIVREAYADKLVCHVSRDATAIEGREKPAKPCAKQTTSEPKKRGELKLF